MSKATRLKRERSQTAAREAVAQAGGIEGRRGAASQDLFTGELRRRAVLPLLVLHLIHEGPSYGNQLMERIAGMTAGVLSVSEHDVSAASPARGARPDRRGAGSTPSAGPAATTR